MLTNLARIAWLELLLSLRIPVSLIYVFLLPTFLLLLFGSRYTNTGLLVTGLTSLMVGTSTLQGVGQVTANMRHGIWKTIRASLHPDWLYLAGVILSRILRTVLVAIVLLISAWIAFGYHLGGSLAVHFGLVLAGSVTFACLGLFLAYLPASPMTATMTMNVIILAMLAVSGVFVVPTGIFRTLSYASPLTFLNDLLRKNAHGGLASPWDAVPGLLVLAAWSAGSAAWAYRLTQIREDE
jgi:ABC-type multidrug transport system permease subunit